MVDYCKLPVPKPLLDAIKLIQRGDLRDLPSQASVSDILFGHHEAAKLKLIIQDRVSSEK